MKQLLTLLLLLSIASTSNAQEEFTVKGRLTNVEDSTVIMLMQDLGTVGLSVAYDTIADGRFELEWQAGNEAEKYSLFVHDEGFPSMSLDIWAKAGSVIEVTGNDKWIHTWDVKSDLPEQAENSRFINASRDHWIEYQRLSVQESDLLKKALKISREEYNKAKPLADSIDNLSDAITKKIKWQELALLRSGPLSDIGLEYLGGVAHHAKSAKDSVLRPQVEDLYNKLSDDQKNSREGKIIYANLFPPKVVQAGEPMFDTDLFDLEGNVHHLSDYKGKFILLDFWSMGCGGCIMSMPEIKELAEEYKDRLTVVSLSIDSEKAWRKGSEIHNITGENLNDLLEWNGIAAKYGVRGIPHYIIISPDGIVVDSWMIGPDQGSLRYHIEKQIKQGD